MTTRNKHPFWAGLAALLIAAVACSSGASTSIAPTPAASLAEYGIPRENALVLPSGELDTLDPAKYLYGAEDLMGDLYSGLVRLGANLQPVPDLAEDWTVSEDELVYTFKLRSGVTFHDGRPFTADDVRYSWERALSPALESPTAMTYLNDIVGATDFAAGKAKSLAGVKVIDDHTLRVTLDAPKVYFLYKIAFPTAWVVDQKTVDQIETAPNGTGPFTLERHDKNKVYILKKNPNYYLTPVKLDYVVYLVYPGYPQRLYETGDIDMVSISADLLDRARNPADPLAGNIQAVNSFCNTRVVLDVAQPPFEDPLVRRAFVLAVDKDRLNETLMNGTGVMAQGLYPPGLPGYNPELKAASFDSTAAAKALADSTYGGPAKLPPITFTAAGGAGNVSSAVGLLIQMWKDALGVTVQVESLDSDTYTQAINAGKHGQLLMEGWCADFPDPETFADLFFTGSKENKGHYSNAQVDALLLKARSDPDAAGRIALYQQVEQILVDESAAIFLIDTEPYYVVTKPYVNGYIATSIGTAQHMDMSIDHNP